MFSFVPKKFPLAIWSLFRGFCNVFSLSSKCNNYIFGTKSAKIDIHRTKNRNFTWIWVKNVIRTSNKDQSCRRKHFGTKIAIISYYLATEYVIYFQFFFLVWHFTSKNLLNYNIVLSIVFLVRHFT